MGERDVGSLEITCQKYSTTRNVAVIMAIQFLPVKQSPTLPF